MSDRSTPLRGFTCAVAHAGNSHDLACSGIASGLADNGGEVSIALSLRHADGTVLVAYLSEDSIHRLADRLATLIGGEPARGEIPAGVTLQ